MWNHAEIANFPPIHLTPRKKTGYCKQIARQHSCHHKCWPRQGECMGDPVKIFLTSILITQNMVAVCVRACRRFQKSWGCWYLVPFRCGISDPLEIRPSPHWRRNLFGRHGQSRTTFSGGTALDVNCRTIFRPTRHLITM